VIPVVTRVRQSPSTVWRRVGNEVILAPSGRDDFEVLSESGAVVWQLFEVPSTVPEVVGALAQLYGVAEQDIAADVRELVTNLLRSGVIEELQDGHDPGR
jgi:hypothetical protein